MDRLRFEPIDITIDQPKIRPISKARSESLGGDFRSATNGGNFSLVDHAGAKGVSTIYTPKSRHTAMTLRQNSETLYCPFTKNNPNTDNHGKK